MRRAERLSLRSKLRETMGALWRHRYKLVVVAGLTALAGVVEALRRPDVYQAQAAILIESGRENVFLAPLGPEDMAFMNRNMERFVLNELQVLNSRDLAARLVDDIGPTNLYPDLLEADGDVDIRDRAIEAFRGSLQVRGFEDADLIRITFSHPQPEVAANVTRRFVDLFQTRHLEIYGENDITEFLEEQVAGFRTALAGSEEELRDFMLENLQFTSNSERDLLVGRSQSLDQDLNNRHAEIVSLRTRIQSYEDQMASMEKDVDLFTDEGPANNPAREKLLELRLEEKRLLGTFKESNRTVVNVRSQIAVLEEYLAEGGSDVRTRKGQNQVLLNLSSELIRARSDLRSALAAQSVLQGQVVQLTAELQGSAGRAQRYRELDRRRDRQEAQLDLYASRLEDSRLAQLMDKAGLASIRVVDRPVVPTTPISPNRKLIVAMAASLGLFLGALAVIAAEVLNPKLGGPEKAQRETGMPVLATIEFGRVRRI